MEKSQLVKLLNKYRSGLEKGFGVEFYEYENKVRAKFEVKENMLQPFGLLHGGVTALIGEGVASIYANYFAGEGKACVGQVLNVNHVGSAHLGDIVDVDLTDIHIGNSSQIWRVDFYKANKLVAL